MAVVAERKRRTTDLIRMALNISVFILHVVIET